MTKHTAHFSLTNKSTGLLSAKARALLSVYGHNQIEKKTQVSGFKIFASQFTSPLIVILIVAAAITYFLGDIVDTSVVLAAVILNTILGFYQEFRAQRGLEALASMLSPQARVFRDGVYSMVPSSMLVPGDLVSLSAGETIGADGVIIESFSFMVNEAVLTGESVSVAKKACDAQKSLESQYASLNDRIKNSHQSVYMGTSVVVGNAMMQVLFTGEKTEIGAIARQLWETIDDETPLQFRLKKLSSFLTITVIFVATIIFGVGLYKGASFEEIFSLSVAVAVSAIPEGLAVSLTAILAISMQRILKKKALVRKLLAAEVLGSVTVICSDKTGTLTEGTMRVSRVETDDEKALVKAALLGNTMIDPLDLGMWEWAEKTLSASTKTIIEAHPLLDQLPFNPDLRYAAKLFSHGLYVIGAPETVLSFSNMSILQRKIYQEKITAMAVLGLRVVAFGFKEVSGSKLDSKKVSSNLHFLGLLGFEDPVRRGVARALEKSKEAGVKVKVITGDYRETARGVMKQLGWEIREDQIMNGDALAKMSTIELQRKVDEIVLFARTTPSQKLKIVNALQARGEVVAMTGDGVNDAPALKKADIGIVVASASDVSKETADVVLLDSNFATIVAAIEEGRGIFENLRKVTLYLLSNAFAEMIIILVSLFGNLPLPITAAQILWINLVDDGLPNIALALDPKEKNLLLRKPRAKSEGLVSHYMYAMMAVVSLVSVLVVGGIFWWYLKQSTLSHAQTMAFTTLGIGTLFYALTSRSMSKVFWQNLDLSNPSLWMAIIGGFALQSLAIYNPFIRHYLGTYPLSVYDWIIVSAACLMMLLVIELFKMIYLKLFPYQENSKLLSNFEY